MADFCDEFVTWIRTVAGLTALIGTSTSCRVYPDQLKQGATLPALVYAESGGEDVTHLGGLAALCRTVMHTWCYGATRAAANALDQALFVAMCPTPFTTITMGSTAVTEITRSSHRETGTDGVDGGSDVYRYWTHSVFDVWHAQTTS